MNFVSLSKKIRRNIIRMTTAAGSGHVTSSLSATDLMTVLFFGNILRYSVKNPSYHNNDRIIFSKGHASPLFFALFAEARGIKEQELLRYRKFGSKLEGHPTMAFPYTESPTGSLGQGLSVGFGEALAAKLDKLPYTTYVLLGDSEMAEGQVWEAIQLAAHYRLNSLVAIIDVNRLGQSGPTMYGHSVHAYEQRLRAFGWATASIDGHSFQEIFKALTAAKKSKKPFAIIAKTIKGKGVSFLENKNGWHGKALDAKEAARALQEIGADKKTPAASILQPKKIAFKKFTSRPLQNLKYNKDVSVSTRKAYGNGLVRLAAKYPGMVVLDAEVSNSTFAELFKHTFPKKFFEMYIAEQNMVSAAVGLSRRGKLPFISTFSAFLTRAFDQLRIAQYANVHMIVCGSHAGVSIGQDGASQMGLQDVAMFRTLNNTTVLYPSDAIATEKLVEQAARAKGIVYLRTTRAETPILYKATDSFPIGKSKTIRKSKNDVVTVIAAGITVHEALAAHDELLKEKLHIRIIDCYSIKPIDAETIRKAARETRALIVVEDHVPEGGIADAVRSVFSKSTTPILSLAVNSIPKSGKPSELLAFEKISAAAISAAVRRVIR